MIAMPDPAPVRIVAVRRLTPVSLSVRVRAGSPAASPVLEVCAGRRRIGTIADAGARVPALRALLTGPAWLLVVAAEVHADLVGRVWALVPAGDTARSELRDDDLVYAVPLGSVQLPGSRRSHPADLLAEARHLLATLARDAPRGT